MVGRDVNWDDIRVFLAYMRCGSVASAAEALKISGPTVSRRMAALQDTLGFPLLNRTPAGLELSEAAQPLIEVWQDAEKLLINGPTLANRMREPQKIELRFSTTPALASAIVFPHLSAYTDRWPNVMLDVDTSVRVVDIGAGQGDVALRYVEPERGAVVRQRVGTISFNVYCSAALLPDGFQPLTDWDELAQMGIRAVTWAPGASVSMPQQKLRDSLGKNRTGISITEFSGLIEAIGNGLGAGILPDVVGRRLPGVRPVMIDGTVGDMPLWLVTADRLTGYRHINDFRDFIRDSIAKAQAFSSDLPSV